MAADRCRSPVGLSSRPSTWSGSPYRGSTPRHHQCRFGRGILPVQCRGGGCAGARVDRGYLAVERGRDRVQHREQHGPRAWGTSLASASDVARARPSTADWRVQASYFEACNCEAICPCRSVGGRPGQRALPAGGRAGRDPRAGLARRPVCRREAGRPGRQQWHCERAVLGELLHCHALGREVLDGLCGPGLGHAAGGGENGGAVPEATMRAAHPWAIARCGAYPPLACTARLSRQVSGRAVHRPCAGESPLPSRWPNQPFCKD